MAEDPLDRVAVMATEVRFHRDPFVGSGSVAGDARNVMIPRGVIAAARAGEQRCDLT
jgi:hypothetical protein